MADIQWDLGIPNPSTFTMGLRSNVFKAQSMYTGASRTLGIPGARWFVRMGWDMLGRDQGDLLRSLLVRLRGGANRLVMHDIAQPQFRGVGGGSPQVNGAAQTGASLNVDGCPPSVTGWALPGDKFSVGGELKMVVAVANTNSSGQTALVFEPVLRASPADNSPLVLAFPTARFILSGPDATWTHETVITSSIELEAEEAFL